VYLSSHGSSALGTVVGADGRQRVGDVTRPPYRWICSLDLFFPFNGAPQLNKGTGFLISPRHVLTTAHNVTPAPGVRALSINVVPGLDGTNLLGKPAAPVGSLTVLPVSCWVPSPYETTRDLAWDFALLTLPREVPPHRGSPYGYWSDPRFAPATRVLPIRSGSLTGAAVSIAGYPADKCGTKDCAPCAPSSPASYDPLRAKSSWASTQWEATGTIQAGPPPGLIIYNADSCVGMSGSPVWQSPKPGELVLIGIHTGAHQQVNTQTGQTENLGRAVPLVGQLVDLLRQRMQTDVDRSTIPPQSARVSPSF